MFSKSSSDRTKNKIDYYRGIDCIKKWCEKIINSATEIINYEKQEMILLTDEDIKFYEEQKDCNICKKEVFFDENDENKFKLCQKVRNHCRHTGKFRGAAHSICNLRYKLPRETPVVIHNGSTYDYHFIVKQLAEEFKGKF